ncbi:MAG TPA: lipid IV(A) 3-deoxy-D-manno-octulosonic acid transferase, partial [Gammaproteobacteria bacterium]|nr:lipid IV(A) 3-deoxy-D-manno-octulosonic acid transferase [Gammaproteobacteria bacterium]
MRDKLLRWLYSVLMIALSPFILLRLLWRSRRAPDYRRRITERFAFYSRTFKPSGICLHAVSVGELMAARPLITRIMQHYPHLPLTITTTTPTASAQVKKIFADSVQHVYLPYDYPGAVQRFLRAFRPKLMIIMETEIWPNLFYYLHEANIPIIMANARLAEKSLRGYKRFKFFFAPTLQKVTCIAAQSVMDANHFAALSFPGQKIKVMGNIKYDVAVPTHLVERAHQLRKAWPDRAVWIASSTHAVEEALIINTIIALKTQYPHTLCIIAPRHPECFHGVAEKCVAQGLKIARYSRQEDVTPDTEVFIADALGELFFFYALSDIAVVCGSFAPVGGHNVLEPAALGLPIIVGPNMFNFKTILADFLAKAAILQVKEGEELLPILGHTLAHPDAAQEMGERAHQLVLTNQGAIDNLW